MKYEVDITETYKRTIEIEAGSLEEAQNKVDEMIDGGEIDLPCDGDDFDYERELFARESED